MKSITAFLVTGLLAFQAAASPFAKGASSSWAGTSLYYLQGLSDSDQDAYLSKLSSDGAKVVRVWVNSQHSGQCIKGNNIVNSCDEFETTIGKYNYTTLDLLDAALVKIAKYGMKALISPHNANSLSAENGDVYGSRWGSGDMYTSSDAANAYDKRLTAILNYKGAHSGQVWKNWHDGIMGFDIENEPMVLDQQYSAFDPFSWMCNRASHMRSVLGANNPIKIASGGAGGAYSNGANFASWVTSCASLDIVSVHYYSDNGWSDADFIGQAKGKLVHIEEWTTNQGSGQASEWANDAAQINALGIPWCLWQVLPHQTCTSQESDKSGLVIDKFDVAGPMKAANGKTAAQDWTGVIY